MTEEQALLEEAAAVIEHALSGESTSTRWKEAAQRWRGEYQGYSVQLEQVRVLRKHRPDIKD